MRIRRGFKFETAFGSYEVVKQIGEGGSGRVFSVLDENNRCWAIKCIDSNKADRKKTARFKNELHFCESVEHENIIHVRDRGYVQAGKSKLPFYSMRLYDETLRSLIHKRMQPKQILDIFSQILNAIRFAHGRNVIHRDMKPENVLYDTNEGRAVVADFGVARFSEAYLIANLKTVPQERLANFEYAAPEQRKKGAIVDRRADIYALGLIFNEMFTNTCPLGTDYREIGEVQPDFGFLDPIVARMLSQDPGKRVPDVDAIRREIAVRSAQSDSDRELEELRNIEIEESDIKDPLVAGPVKVKSADYQDGDLIFSLNHDVTNEWIQVFRHIRIEYSLRNHDPGTFKFLRHRVVANASDGDGQSVADYLKKCIEQANTEYRAFRESEIRKEEEQRRAELNEKIAKEEERNRVLKQIKI